MERVSEEEDGDKPKQAPTVLEQKKMESKCSSSILHPGSHWHGSSTVPYFLSQTVFDIEKLMIQKYGSCCLIKLHNIMSLVLLPRPHQHPWVQMDYKVGC